MMVVPGQAVGSPGTGLCPVVAAFAGRGRGVAQRPLLSAATAPVHHGACGNKLTPQGRGGSAYLGFLCFLVAWLQPP